MGSMWGFLCVMVLMGSALTSVVCAEDSPPKGGRIRAVVDPGHGGRDPGFRGPEGVQEKELTLTLAREIREAARATDWLQVRLTRERDESFSWERRRGAAQGADLWISLHINADMEGEARGPRVFHPHEKTVGSGDRSPSESESDVKAILRDMAHTKTYNESLLLAQHLQQALERTMGVTSRPSAAAPLLGMETLDCPAVLVEAGFLSHPADRKWIAEPQNRHQLAMAILQGIRSFLQDPRKEQ